MRPTFCETHAVHVNVPDLFSDAQIGGAIYNSGITRTPLTLPWLLDVAAYSQSVKKSLKKVNLNRNVAFSTLINKAEFENPIFFGISHLWDFK